MSLRLAILGLDPAQREWLDALSTLAGAGDIDISAVGHRTIAAAKETAIALKSSDAPTPPAFDDLRLLLKEGAPQLILIDRPSNVSIDFLLACLAQDIALFSLGPPVESLAEAQMLSAALLPRTHQLYIWPRFADSPASLHCAQAEDFVRPIRFAAATWMGVNYALAKTAAASEHHDLPVRSLSVLAWDAIGSLIRLIDLPTSVYAAIRGTLASGNTFADLSGAASITARFPDDVAASITLSDRALSPTWSRPSATASRDLLLWGGGGTLHLDAYSYQFRNPEGQLIDAFTGRLAQPASTPRLQTLDALRKFIRHYSLPPSPHRGWDHRLEDIAATMEAVIVSHRTGQAESPERFRRLRH